MVTTLGVTAGGLDRIELEGCVGAAELRPDQAQVGLATTRATARTRSFLSLR